MAMIKAYDYFYYQSSISFRNLLILYFNNTCFLKAYEISESGSVMLRHL